VHRLIDVIGGSRMVIIIRIKPAWPTCGRTHLAFWARMLGVAAMGMALSATTVADLPAQPRPQPDPRIARLEKFFEIYHCPTPRYTSQYLRAADRYGLDYRLLPAVSIRETSCGKTANQRNNLWGYHPGRQEFPTIEAGLEVLARRLAEDSLYKGKALPDKLFTYNPVPAYVDEVTWIMRQIE
jgi:hypothetical protein